MRDNTEITTRGAEVPSASVNKPQLRRAGLMSTTPSTAEALVGSSAPESEAACNTPTMILSLQRLAGNKAVAGLIGRSRLGRRGSDFSPTQILSGELAKESTDEMRRLQRSGTEDGETFEPSTSASREVGPQTGSSSTDSLVRGALSSPGQPLDESTRAFMEPRFHQDLGHVRVHSEMSSAESSADAVNALAYTVGSDIVFGPGQYSPRTEAGTRLLVHELTHVVQEKSASPTRILRQAKSAADVKSLHIEEDLKNAVIGAQNFLDRKVKAREKDINDLIKDVQTTIDKSSNPDVRKRNEDKLSHLRADLQKPLSEILEKSDSKWIFKGHRKDIKKAKNDLDAKQEKVKTAEVTWHKHDTVFDARTTTSSLPAGFTAADLKALIGQESGDFTIKDTKGDIAGIAQMGSEVVKEVGGKPKDRLDPTKAIPLAAKVLKKKTDQLLAALSTTPPTGDELKKFVFASYNAGASTIAEAAMEAKTAGGNPAVWDDLIAGGNKSALRKGIVKRLPKLDPDNKLKETTEYVQRILRRLK